MRIIFASRCTLEPLSAEHARDMFQVLSDPKIYEFENAPPESEAWLTKRYNLLESREASEGDEKWLNWVVRLPSGDLAGYVQATIQSNAASYVAYELGSRHWCQGIGSAAVQAVLEELRTHYQVQTFIAVLKARNFRSEALLRKLGFVDAPEQEQARYRDESDEMVMVKSARRTSPA